MPRFFAQCANFIGEGDFDGVKKIAAVFDGFGGGDGGVDELAGHIGKDGPNAFEFFGVIGSNDGEGRGEKIFKRGAFAQKFWVHGEAEIDASLAAAG